MHGRKIAMPSMREASDRRCNTTCSNHGRNINTDISSSAAPVSTSIVSLPDSSGCGGSAHKTVMKKASSAAPADPSHVPPAGVHVQAVRRIENTISRQVTFCKRRTRLFKNAYELSVLGNAEVAVLVFSPSGRMHHYASSSMSDILERYRDCRSSRDGLPAPPNSADLLLQDGQFWRHEAFRLRQHFEYLTDLHSYLMGENLSSLPLSDIKMIETTLEAVLYRTRVRKMELLQLQNQATSEKERFLHIQEENESLKRTLAEVTAIGHGPNKSSIVIGTAYSSRTDFESNGEKP